MVSLFCYCRDRAKALFFALFGVLARRPRFLPRLRALVDFGLWYAYYLFHQPAEAFKGFLVWRFGFFHCLKTLIVVCVVTISYSGISSCSGFEYSTKGRPMFALKNIDVCNLAMNEHLQVARFVVTYFRFSQWRIGGSIGEMMLGIRCVMKPFLFAISRDF